MKQILTPHALDDAGAVCAAMIKAQLQDKSLNLYPLIDNYLDFILNKNTALPMEPLPASVHNSTRFG